MLLHERLSLIFDSTLNRGNNVSRFVITTGSLRLLPGAVYLKEQDCVCNRAQINWMLLHPRLLLLSKLSELCHSLVIHDVLRKQQPVSQRQ